MIDVLEQAEEWVKWILYRDTIVATLRRYPEAKAAVIATFEPMCTRNGLALDLVQALQAEQANLDE